MRIHSLQVKIPVELDRKLQALADERMCSKSALVRELIQREARRKGLLNEAA
jgi:predicted transcriptional regulator